MQMTPLRRWLRANALNPRNRKPDSITALAREFKVTRACAQFWVKRQSMPQGRTLDKLIDLTGLEIKQLLPDEKTRQRRRKRLKLAAEKRQRRQTALLAARTRRIRADAVKKVRRGRRSNTRRAR